MQHLASLNPFKKLHCVMKGSALLLHETSVAPIEVRQSQSRFCKTPVNGKNKLKKQSRSLHLRKLICFFVGKTILKMIQIQPDGSLPCLAAKKKNILMFFRAAALLLE